VGQPQRGRAEAQGNARHRFPPWTLVAGLAGHPYRGHQFRKHEYGEHAEHLERVAPVATTRRSPTRCRRNSRCGSSSTTCSTGSRRSRHRRPRAATSQTPRRCISRASSGARSYSRPTCISETIVRGCHGGMTPALCTCARCACAFESDFRLLNRGNATRINHAAGVV
jgi:hypothetical protein